MARSTLSRPSSSTSNSSQREPRVLGGDRTVGAHLGVVARALQQAVGDAGRAPGAAGDLLRAFRLERHAEDAGGALDDGDEVVGVVVVEAGDEAEAVAQRAGDQTGAGGGTDQREAREVEADRSRRRALADHDVELEVLHRRVEHLFDRARQAVDLVDEQHVAVVEVGEDGGEVTGALERGTAGDAQPDAHLLGDDARERGLAQARRTGEQDVVGGLAPAAGGAEEDLEVLLEARLADELVEPPRPEGDLFSLLDRVGRRVQQFVSHGATYACDTDSSLSASRRRSSTEPSSGSCATTSRTSSGA